MRKYVVLAGLILLVASSAMAQDTPKAEIAGTYTYVRINPGGGAPGENCHGGGGSIAGNFNSWFGVVGDFSGCKVTGLGSGVSANAFTYLFGPKISYRSHGTITPYAQALFGGARASVDVSGVGSTTDNAFAMTVGGGVDLKVSPHVAIRLVQAEYLLTRFASTSQHNARIQAGIVFRLGGR